MKVNKNFFFSARTRPVPGHRMEKRGKEEIAVTRRKDAPPAAEVAWHREDRTLTLDREPVLTYVLSRPEVTGGGLGGRWINAYYARLARSWRERWEREVYWKSCLELSGRRAASREFIPWTGRLEGEVTWLGDGLLSIRMEGEEVRGDGRPCRVRWGDTWKLREGAPCPLKEFFHGDRGWKGKLYEQVLHQGRERRAGGDCFLDPDWEGRIKRSLPLKDYCLTQDGLELALPQCLVAPAAEGTPVFLLPFPTAQQ